MYQFLHHETYSIFPSKNKKQFMSVAREFMREPYSCPHVPNPKPPIIVYGVNAYEAEAVVRKRVEKAKDKLGRKLRNDAQVILSGVCSLPPEIYKRDLDFGTKVTEKWINDNLRYLKKKYNENLLSVIAHFDEGEPIHPHLHFIVSIPDTDKNGEANLMYIHAPIFARQNAEGGRKNKYDAYKKSYRELQDEYYKDISSNYGLSRLGPRRQRLSRSEYQAQKAQMFAIKDKYNDLRKREECLRSKELEYDERKNSLNKKIIKLRNKLKNLAVRESYVRKLIDSKYDKDQVISFYKQRVLSAKKESKEYEDLYKENRSLRLKSEDVSNGYRKNNMELKEKNKALTREVEILKQRINRNDKIDENIAGKVILSEVSSHEV